MVYSVCIYNKAKAIIFLALFINKHNKIYTNAFIKSNGNAQQLIRNPRSLLCRLILYASGKWMPVLCEQVIRPLRVTEKRM